MSQEQKIELTRRGVGDFVAKEGNYNARISIGGPQVKCFRSLTLPDVQIWGVADCAKRNDAKKKNHGNIILTSISG
jgi:hypothetical protein